MLVPSLRNNLIRHVNCGCFFCALLSWQLLTGQPEKEEPRIPWDEAVELYKKGGRIELLKAEESEIKIIDSFLPKQLGEEEIMKICKESIQSLGASSIKDMGKIMASLKQKYSNSIDFSKANIIVKDLLNK